MKKVLVMILVLAVCISMVSSFTVSAADLNLIQVVGDFETGTDNWQWGANVVGLGHVTSMANGPGTPFHGSRLGEMSSTAVAGTTWRSIYKNFATPINATSMPYFRGAFNTYGINSSHTNFEIRLTFYSNSQTFVSTLAISADMWNERTVDLSGWSYKNNITKIEISFRSTSYTTNWLARHQVDRLGFSNTNGAISGQISSISAGSTQISATGSCTSSTARTLSIIELAPYSIYNPAETYTPLQTNSYTPSNNVINFSFNFNRINNNIDRAYSKFAVIDNSTKELIDTKYVTNVTSSVNTYSFPTATSIKGLQVQTIDDSQKLGIGHAALNVAFNNLFLPSSSTNEKISFTMDGETFYFRKAYINELDRDTKTVSDDGVIVSFILIMYDLQHCGSQSVKDWWNESATINNYLLHPQYSGSGTVAAFNTTNANGVKYFKAAMEFLASRYTRADQAYGRAVNYIVGNEINSQYYWYDMGNKTVEEFVNEYSQAFRIVNTAIKKYYSNGRAYISLDHFWNGSQGADPLKTYKGKDIVDVLNDRIKQDGDIGWNVAHHPYPENLFNPRVWLDTTATDSFNTIRITFKNLHILSNYMNQSAYLFNGQMRRIILSEQGFHSLSNSAADQQIQAAAYAYSYYKAKFTPGIDSFILHRHVDHGLEGGLNLGIWTRDTSKSIAYAPGNPKYLYNVFSKIDTSESVSVTDFAKSIIGITNWSQVIPGYDAIELADRTLPTVGTLSATAINPTTQVSTFESGTDGWIMSEYTTGMTRVTSFANSPGTPYSGSYALDLSMADLIQSSAESYGGARAEHSITKTYATPINMSNTPKFGFAFNSYGGCPGATQYNVTVRIYSGNNIIEGKTTITPDSWNTRSMNISGWEYKNSINKIKIWFNTNSTYNWNAHFQVDSIGFE